MKKIVGFQNKGGMILKRKLKIYDKELVEMIGKKGVKKLIKTLELNATYRKLGKLIYCPIEEALAEMEEIIDNAIMEKRYRV